MDLQLHLCLQQQLQQQVSNINTPTIHILHTCRSIFGMCHKLVHTVTSLHTLSFLFKKNTIGAYLLMYMCMFILKIPLNPSQHVGVGGAWYELCSMDCDSLLCYVKFRDIIQPNLSVHVFWQLTHVQLKLIQPLVQLLVCQSLSPL